MVKKFIKEVFALNSMTGYSYQELSTEKNIISVEFKSVNSRFLDLTINLPPYLNQLESYFRNLISEKVVRGKVDVFIRIKELESDVEITADTSIAKSYYNAIKNVAEQTTGNISDIPLSLIISQPGVLNVNKSYDVEKYKTLIEPIFFKALQEFLLDRKREGENLFKDLKEKLQKLTECALFFKEWQPKMEEAFKEQIIKKFTELLGSEVDQNRIMTETASLVVKYTINEEIVRLFSHIEAMNEELKNNLTPGKKLDFICQEMNREINTIGSKNQFTQVGQMVITAKDALENIREQSKNIE